MGTTLTGTTPQDTYDSLIKVTDNGPLTGSLKKLTDGLGNDSSLSLSTAAASFSGTLAVTGNATFDTNTLFVDAANNRVGINTITPTAKLDVQAAALGTTSGNTSYASIFSGNNGNSAVLEIKDIRTANGSDWTSAGKRLQMKIDSLFMGYVQFNGNSNNSGISFATGITSDAAGNVDERLRITSDGYIRLATTSSGIQFNGDTAAANALDDYEEGTWTMGVSFGGAAVGVTYSENTGTYTKIGRQVTVNGYLQLTSKGSSTGDATITGLPFTVPNNNPNYSAVSLWFNNITFANQFIANGTINTTTISLQESTILGVNTPITDADFANNSGIIVSLTYFV